MSPTTLLPAASRPSLRGWITTFYIKHRGKRLGPYYARCWKQNGKRYRQYVRHEDLARVTAACENHRQKRRREIVTSKWTDTVCANLSYLHRVGKKIGRRTISNADHQHLGRIADQGLEAPGRPIQSRIRRFMGPHRKKRAADFANVEERDRVFEVNRAMLQARVRKQRAKSMPPRLWAIIPLPAWLSEEEAARDSANVPLITGVHPRAAQRRKDDRDTYLPKRSA